MTKIGQFTVIEDDVQIGDGVEIGHNVSIKAGARIGNNVKIDDGCSLTGLCYVGNDVVIKAGSVIARGVIVEDKSFIGSRVSTSSARRVSHCRPDAEKENRITRIGYGSIIGSGVVLSSGITIGNNALIGFGQVITFNVDPYTVCASYSYKFRKVRNYEKVPIDPSWRPFNFTPEDLKKYLPYADLHTPERTI